MLFRFQRATGGLFGYWDGNPSNDLMPRNGGSSGTTVNPSDDNAVYYSFGMTCAKKSLCYTTL